jgi:hypothetical protein
MADPVAEHDQAETHRYVFHFPEHFARTDDPHYRDFDAYHRKTRASARCYVGERIGFEDCRDAQGVLCVIDANGQMTGMELHHAHIEFAVQQGVSLAALEKDYPGVSDAESVGAWIETADNLRWICAYHHRGAAGCHTASHSDWEASQYVEGCIRAVEKAPKPTVHTPQRRAEDAP